MLPVFACLLVDISGASGLAGLVLTFDLPLDFSLCAWRRLTRPFAGGASRPGAEEAMTWGLLSAAGMLHLLFQQLAAETAAVAEAGGAAGTTVHAGHRQGREQAGGPGHRQAQLSGPQDQRCLVGRPEATVPVCDLGVLGGPSTLP